MVRPLPVRVCPGAPLTLTLQVISRPTLITVTLADLAVARPDCGSPADYASLIEAYDTDANDEAMKARLDDLARWGSMGYRIAHRDEIETAGTRTIYETLERASE